MALSVPEGYEPLQAQRLPGYLAGIAHLAARLGGRPEHWRVQEVSDGNVNQVFRVHGPDGDVCVKQSLPYVRLVGESWPLTLERIHFEHLALLEHGRHTGRRVPEVLHYDARLFLLVVECLTPHLILREGMTAGLRYPRLAGHLADFLARSLFFTSSLALPAEAKKAGVAAFCANTAMCRIMEDMVFTEPYQVHPRNRWTSPALDGLAAEVREDVPLKLAASRLKRHYLDTTEALLHGDLHTGSIMVTQEDTRIIDQEFAFYGPMAFDVGSLLAHLLLNFFSQDGHSTAEAPRDAYASWVLETVEAWWSSFHDTFLQLWEEQGHGAGDPSALFTTPTGRAALQAERRAFLQRLWEQGVAYAGAELLRRIFGLAHTLDLERIQDVDRRATCEARCVQLARSLLVEPGRYRSVFDVTAAAREVGAGAPRRQVG
ncbi:S-methyl-5-thioribose kinase [Corallococcus sp. CA053C]|uniref:S-methyl-5-thioribose kinase n=1 Tax=Corallococcus sp. CA053C TaxID=2316732 RepID=UPI000EA1A9D1|nr:S-methyl-5-thioribose kinase [Corallococcus sp. CA053C]RKG97941.1 S-methyl-5-thioribose kinase [Corallococcus sp. CA053C]